MNGPPICLLSPPVVEQQVNTSDEGQHLRIIAKGECKVEILLRLLYNSSYHAPASPHYLVVNISGSELHYLVVNITTW